MGFLFLLGLSVCLCWCAWVGSWLGGESDWWPISMTESLQLVLGCTWSLLVGGHCGIDPLVFFICDMAAA